MKLVVDLSLTKLMRISVPRGDVYHGLKASDPSFQGFGELYFSRIDYQEIKGWEKHKRLTLNLMVPAGEVRFVVFASDALSGKPTELCGDYRLGADVNHQRLTVPAGMWVAFQGCSSTINIVANVIPEEHDPAEADNLELSQVPFDWSGA